MSAAIWSEPPDSTAATEAHPNLGTTSIPARQLPGIGYPQLPNRAGAGVLYMRVYGVTASGTRYALPPDVEPVLGVCIVPGCDCGGPACDR